MAALNGSGISTYGYFTIQSNLMVCIVLGFAVLAWIREREETTRTAARRRAVHSAVVLYISITALVYNLRRLAHRFALTGAFRYFFLDFASTSAASYVLGLAIVTAMFVAVSLAIVGVNRLVVRKRGRRRA